MPSFSVLLRSRVLSMAFVIFLLVVTYVMTGSMESVFRLLAFLILPLACIWFSDELGNRAFMTSGLMQPRVTEPTPGIGVAIGGWILLLAIMAATLIVNQ